MKNCQKNIIKFGKSSATLSKNSVYNEKYLKIEIKFDNGKININFHNNKIPKEGSHSIFLSVILIDSVYRKKIKTIILRYF